MLGDDTRVLCSLAGVAVDSGQIQSDGTPGMRKRELLRVTTVSSRRAGCNPTFQPFPALAVVGVCQACQATLKGLYSKLEQRQMK